jgi:hypothetical protein
MKKLLNQLSRRIGKNIRRDFPMESLPLQKILNYTIAPLFHAVKKIKIPY